MMRRMAFAAVALAAIGCSRSTTSPSPAPASESTDLSRSVDTATPATTGDGVGPPATAEATGEDRTTTPAAAGFPPVDRSCVRDEDCDTHHRYLTDDGRCCYTCDHRIGNREWVRRVMKLCETKSRAGCPMKKCKAPPELACLEGRCSAAAPSP